MSSEGSWGAFSPERAKEYLRTYGHPSLESRAIVLDVFRRLAGRGTLDVLDVGCGNGALYAFLRASGLRLRYTGVDFSDPLLEAARDRNPEARFVRDDAQTLETVAGQFNVVLYSHVIEMLESPQRSLMRAAELSHTVVIRWFEPPDHETDAVELREMDVGGRAVPYIRRSMSRDYYRLILASIDCKVIDIYRAENSTDQVHVLHFDGD